MPLETLALLAPTFLAGASGFALLRREEMDTLARVLIAAPAALAFVVLAGFGLAGEPLAALALASRTLAAPLGLLVLALPVSRLPFAMARAIAIGLAAISVPAALADLAVWGYLVLATALAVALALPLRDPWIRGVLLAWTPALALPLLGPIVDRSPAGLAAAIVALAALVLGARVANRRPLAAAALVLGLAGALAAALLAPAFGILPLVALPTALTAFAFHRGRALGASSRPLAAVASGYASDTLASALGAPAAMATATGLLVGTIVLFALEAAMPSLDEARARRVALERARREGKPEPSGPLGVGERILGRYQLLERLGEGTFGTAFLAHDEVAGERVVVKALRASAGEDRRILREARAIATVRHPNVIELRDVVEEADGSYLVMEFADGGSLAAWIAKGPLGSEEARHVGLGILDALAAVHAAGLVHRDVKPTNVLLARPSTVKLADFGLARATDAEATMAPGALAPPVGTLRYMAPELARGRPASAASDIYSAAATTYEAFTGRAYLEISPNESAVEIQMRVASMGPFLVSIEPPELQAWFARALDPDPSTRFASAREARDALATIT